MGDLIVMSRATPALSRDFSAGHSAEILFFTGVRYYRMDDAAEASAQTTPTGRRRSSEQRRAARRPRPERKREALG